MKVLCGLLKEGKKRKSIRMIHVHAEAAKNINSAAAGSRKTSGKSARKSVAF